MTEILIKNGKGGVMVLILPAKFFVTLSGQSKKLEYTMLWIIKTFAVRMLRYKLLNLLHCLLSFSKKMMKLAILFFEIGHIMTNTVTPPSLCAWIWWIRSFVKWRKTHNSMALSAPCTFMSTVKRYAQSMHSHDRKWLKNTQEWAQYIKIGF